MMPRIASAFLTVALPAAAVAQEKPAGTQICLAPTTVEASVGSATDVSNAVKETLSGFLTGPSIGVSALSAKLEAQAREEAANAGCRFILFTTAKHQRKQGGGFLEKAAGGAVQQGAWSASSRIGGAGVGRIATDAVAGAAGAAASDLAYSTRSKDEMTLAYRLETADRKVLAKKSDKRKATSDGEDLVTPLAQQT
ncbi:MAG TPA: hypothetical protein VFT84_00745, partial [Gemmatimonadales bacterium]|nr:hypothetical protein [Gemmatimonadales bacterium]